MAEQGVILDIDTKFLKRLEQADAGLTRIAESAEKMGLMVKLAFNTVSKANVEVLNNLAKQWSALSNIKFKPEADTSSVEKFGQEMDNILNSIKALLNYRQDLGFELFDPTSLGITNQSVRDLEEQLLDVNERLQEVRENLADIGTEEGLLKGFSPSVEFTAPINPRTKEPYKSGKKYDAALAEYNEQYGAMIEAERNAYKEQRRLKEQGLALDYELEERALQNTRKVLEQRLAYAKKTELEKAKVIQDASEKEIRSAQRTYGSVLKEMTSLMKKSDRAEKKNEDGALDEQIRGYQQRFLELNNRKEELENQYGVHLVEVAKRANAQILDIQVARIHAAQREEEKARLAAIDAERRTPQGAYNYAQQASTINEMKEAQKYLQEARGNVNVEDEDTIRRLNDEYIRLRATIESLTTAEKNEQSLQPTLRNEYMRLRKELDTLIESMRKYSSIDTVDDDAYDALVAREKDLQDKIAQIRNNAGALLAETDRQYEAQKAQVAVDEYAKAEQKKLELAKQRLREELAEASKSGSISSASAGRLIQIATGASNVTQDEIAVKKLSDALKRLDRNSSDYNETVAKLNRQIKLHEHNIKMATDAQYRENEAKKAADRYNSSRSGALAYSQAAQSITEQIQAIKYLKTARENLNRSSFASEVEYKKAVKELTNEINLQEKSVQDLTNKNKDLGNALKGLLNTADQLKRALMGIFSVSAIKGYVSQLARVRGEFELQQRSLQALLQNKDEANKLWEQTVKLAVRSPFQVSQLVRSTKQLAAYRIESEKLYETNKMLADISAGVGVEIERLILAFGQVKAANFLRGCLGKGTKIQMFNGGVKNVEDIIVGDVILGDDNTERVVSEIIRGKEQMYKVCSKDGSFNEYRVNENHILTLFDTEVQDNVDVYVSEYLDSPNRYLGATQNDVYDIVVTKDIVDDYYGFVIDKNKRFVIENGIITHNTELRQFSEAGINVLGELAEYYTQLEGRMVSVGDVFERVSKRMVSFADVETVLKKVTSAGGQFYNMQEIQANTLRGQISNLKDQIELMLNDIGKSNEGVLKGSVSAIASLLKNWRELSITLTGVGAGILATTAFTSSLTKGLAKFGDVVLWGSQRLLGMSGATLNFANSLSYAELRASGLTRRAAIMTKAMVRLQLAANAVGAAFMKMLPVLVITGIVELVRWMTKASREAKRLKKELNEIYNEDTSGLDKQIKGFSDLVRRLKEVEKGSKEHKDIISQLNSQYGDYLNYVVDESTSYDRLRDSIESVNTALTQKVKLSIFEKSYSKIAEPIIENITEIEQEVRDIFAKGVFTDAEGMSVIPTNTEIHDVFNLAKENKSWDDYFEGLDFDVREGAALYFLMNKLTYAYQDLAKAEKQAQEQADRLAGTQSYNSRQYRKELEALRKERDEEIQKQTTEWGKEAKAKEFYEQELRIKFKYEQPKGSEKELEAYLEKELKEYEKRSATIIDINSTIAANSKKLGETYANMIYIGGNDSLKSISEIAEDAAAGYKAAESAMKQELNLKEAGTEYDEKAIDDAKKRAEAYKYLLSILGRLDLIQDKGKGGDKTGKTLSNRIRLIKELNKKYEELRDSMGETEAKAEVVRAFKDTFAEAFDGTDISLTKMVFSKEKLEALKADAEKSGKIISEEMESAMAEMSEKGVYIRNFSDELVEFIKKHEGFRADVYKDVVGVKTQGYGETIDIEEGVSWTEEKAEAVLRNSLAERYVGTVNKILDANKDLVLTQEQYNALLDVAYHGGGGSLSALISRVKDVEKGVQYIERISSKIKATLGEEAAGRFGEEFVQSFREAESIYERIALMLQVTNLTAGGEITSWYKGMQKIADWRSEMFSGSTDFNGLLKAALVEVEAFDFTNLDSIIEKLKSLAPIAKKEGAKAELELSKAISEVEVILNVQTRKQADADFAQEIENMFSGYELSIELGKLNIPSDFAEQFFGLESVSLADIRKKLEDELNTDISKDRKKQVEKDLQKVNEMEAKAQQERLKKYLQYSRDAIGERAKIKLEELKQLQEIEQTFTGDDETSQVAKQKAIEHVKEESYQKDQKQQWEEFQKSDLFLSLFNDLDNASNKLLEHSIAKLEEFKNQWRDMPLEDMKTIVEKINQLEDQLIENQNPFEATRTLKAERAKDPRTNEQITQDNIAESKKIAAAQAEIALLQQILTLQQEGNMEAADDVAVQAGRTELFGAQAEELQGQLDAQKDIVTNSTKNIAQNNQTLNINNKIRKSYQKQADAIKDAQKMANDLYGAFKDLSEVLGADSDSPAAVFADMGMSMANSVLDTIALQFQLTGATTAADMFGASMNSAMGIIGWIVMAVQIIAKVLSAVFAAHDNKLEAQIEKDQEVVEGLQKKLEELQEALDKAFSTKQLEEYTKQFEHNAMLQIAAYDRMIAAEQDKKKTDTEKIEDWQDEQAALRETLEETAEQVFSTATAGILDDAMDAASAFVDAWFEAFQETGNGMKGLEENFKEILLDMVKQQAALQIVGVFTDKYKQMLSEYVNEDDTELSTEEAKEWAERVKATFPEMNASLEGMFEGFGNLIEQSGELSDLSKGIQGVTETTAQVIEAYLNSVRFYVADSNAKLTQIANSVLGNGPDNPMVAQLRVIAQQTTAINELLDSVTKVGHSAGGSGIKVFISD